MRVELREKARWAGEAPEAVVELAWLLRNLGIHEARQVAFELLEKRKDARSLLGVEEVRGLGEGNDNWASVDAFSGYVSGPLWREGAIPDEEVLAWTRSEDLWWRRTALVKREVKNKLKTGKKNPNR